MASSRGRVQESTRANLKAASCLPHRGWDSRAYDRTREYGRAHFEVDELRKQRDAANIERDAAIEKARLAEASAESTRQAVIELVKLFGKVMAEGSAPARASVDPIAQMFPDLDREEDFLAADMPLDLYSLVASDDAD